MGTDLDDTLLGRPTGVAANTLLGYAGTDNLEGRGGGDTLVGGDSTDRLRGGTGDDQLYTVDRLIDQVIDCGEGTGDLAVHDEDFDNPANCETLDPVPPPAIAGAGGGVADPSSRAFRELERRAEAVARLSRAG
jgi:hypothetical protein